MNDRDQRDSKLAGFVIEMARGLSDQIEADEAYIQDKIEEDQETTGEATLVIDVPDVKPLAGPCAALSRQFDALFEKSSGNMFLIFYQAGEEIPEHKYWEFKAVGSLTSTSLIKDYQDEEKTKPYFYQKKAKAYFPKDEASLPMDDDQSELLKKINDGLLEDNPDSHIFAKILSNSSKYAFPVLWLTYYLPKTGFPIRYRVIIEEGENEEETIKQIKQIIDEDKIERAKGKLQCLKLIICSASSDRCLSQNIGQFPERFQLASALFGTVITTIARTVIIQQKEKEALNSLALLGEIPHNIKGHFRRINESNIAKLDGIRKLLINRATYLEYVAGYADRNRGKNKIENGKSVSQSYMETPYSLKGAIEEFRELALLAGDLRIEKDSGNSEDNRKASEKKWKEIFQVSGDDNIMCTVLRGAIENAIENLCVNSLKHGQYKLNKEGHSNTNKPIKNFKISIEINKADTKDENWVLLKYRDNGPGFPKVKKVDGGEEKKVKSEVNDWLKGNFDINKGRVGQGIWSIGMAIRRVGGEIQFSEEDNSFEIRLLRERT